MQIRINENSCVRMCKYQIFLYALIFIFKNRRSVRLWSTFFFPFFILGWERNYYGKCTTIKKGSINFYYYYYLFLWLRNKIPLKEHKSIDSQDLMFQWQIRGFHLGLLYDFDDNADVDWTLDSSLACMAAAFCINHRVI